MNSEVSCAINTLKKDTEGILPMYPDGNDLSAFYETSDDYNFSEIKLFLECALHLSENFDLDVTISDVIQAKIAIDLKKINEGLEHLNENLNRNEEIFR